MGGGREYKQEKGEKYKKKYRTTITSVRRQTPATAEEAELSTHGWGQQEGGSPPRVPGGCRITGGPGWRRAGRAGLGGLGGAWGQLSPCPGQVLPPLPLSPPDLPPRYGLVGGGGGRRPGQQHSSRDTSEHGGEKCREGDEARGGSRQRLRESCHRPQHHSHGTRSLGGSVPTPGGGSSYLGRLLLLSSPPESHEMGNAELQGAKTGGPHGAVAAGPSV